MPEIDTLSFQGKNENDEWLPIPRISRIIPWGYEEDPEDRDVLLPIPFELDALELAKKYIKSGEYSYRNVADWLSHETGRRISHMGLKKRIENERKRRTRANAYTNWAKQIEKARKKAATLERKLGFRQSPN